MSWKRWLLGILWLLAAPTLVVAAFAAMTLWSNARPQEGALQVAVEPQIVWPWQDAELQLTIADAGSNEPLPLVDLVFMVDISGSMWDSLPAMAEAVRAVAAFMPHDAEATHFALVRFDTAAEVLVPWTEDPDQLGRGLDRLLPAITGQNDTRAAFDRLREVLADARPKAERVAVWYTDGYLDACPFWICSNTMSYDEIAAAAAELQSQGVQVFAVAPPNARFMPHEVLHRMAGPGGVFEPRRSGELASSFERITAQALRDRDTSARLEQRLDVRHFAPLRSGLGWRPMGADTLALETAMFPGRTSTFPLSLDAKSMGWWNVGIEPALLVRPGEAGEMVELRAGRRPTLLVLTWWTLLWLVLPALLWGLLHRPRRIVAVKQPLAGLPQIRAATLPDRLPPLPPAAPPPLQPIPTLFLGIGGHGRDALEAIRNELGALHCGATSCHRFLAFDLDRRAAAAKPVISTLAPVELHLAPPAVTEVGPYLPATGRVPAAWSWFNPDRYHDAAREQLDLAGGARGDRALARLALFRWLAEGEVLAVLCSALTDLVRQEAAAERRQVVVVACTDGGFGSGTLIDWGRWLKRLGRRLQLEDATTTAPEVVGILVDDPDRARPENRRALALELQSAQATGAHPWETAYGDAPELCQVDGEPPFHVVLGTSGETRAAALDQAAQTAALLAEVVTRTALIEEVFGVTRAHAHRSEVVRVQVRTVQLLPAIEQERRRLDLLARLLGPDVLLDLQVDSEGTVRTPVCSDQELDQRLADWARTELSGAPLALLLAACSGCAKDLSALSAMAGRWPDNVGTWLCEALRASVDRKLCGQLSVDGWRRGWMPAEAAAILAQFAHRLGNLPISTASMVEPIRQLAAAATATAGALQRWLANAAGTVKRVSEQRFALELWQRRLESLSGRQVVTRALAVDDDVRAILAQWLGQVDTISALREHLFATVVGDGDACKVVVRDHLEAARSHGDWWEVEERLELLVTRLADSRPPSRLGQVLQELGAEERKRLSMALIVRAERPDRVLLALPRVEAATAEAQAVAAFAGEIPQPADHGADRREVESTHATSVRRLALTCEVRAEAGADLPLAAAPEQHAEKLRQRLERQYRRTFPMLPVPLRIALTQGEAFVRFADAYLAGRLVQRRDGAGQEQWYDLDEKRFLTAGQRSGLADAAAAYTARPVSAVTDPVPSQVDAQPGGDVFTLEQWLASSAAPSDDILTLAAIQACTSRQP